MSNLLDKIKRSKRFFQKSFTLATRLKTVRQINPEFVPEEPNKYAKAPLMRCSHSYCTLCGNPRRVFGQVTLKEKLFKDIEKYELDLLAKS